MSLVVPPTVRPGQDYLPDIQCHQQQEGTCTSASTPSGLLRCNLPPYGNVLVATRHFEPGEVVMVEQPLLATEESSGLADEVHQLLEQHGLSGATGDVEGLDASLDFCLQLLMYCKADPATQAKVLAMFSPSTVAHSSDSYVRAAKRFVARLQELQPPKQQGQQAEGQQEAQQQGQEPEHSTEASNADSAAPSGEDGADAGVAEGGALTGVLAPLVGVDTEIAVQVLLTWSCNSYAYCSDGCALFELASLVTHSCENNLRYRFYEREGQEGVGEAHFVVVRPISPGSVLTANYLGYDEYTMMSTPMRQRQLWKTKMFQCDCPRCTQQLDYYRCMPCPGCPGYVCCDMAMACGEESQPWTCDTCCSKFSMDDVKQHLQRRAELHQQSLPQQVQGPEPQLQDPADVVAAEGQPQDLNSAERLGNEDPAGPACGVCASDPATSAAGMAGSSSSSSPASKQEGSGFAAASSGCSSSADQPSDPRSAGDEDEDGLKGLDTEGRLEEKAYRMTEALNCGQGPGEGGVPLEELRRLQSLAQDVFGARHWAPNVLRYSLLQHYYTSMLVGACHDQLDLDAGADCGLDPGCSDSGAADLESGKGHHHGLPLDSCPSAHRPVQLALLMVSELDRLWSWLDLHTSDEPAVVLKSLLAPASFALLASVQSDVVLERGPQETILQGAQRYSEALVKLYEVKPWYDVAGDGLQEAKGVWQASCELLEGMVSA